MATAMNKGIKHGLLTTAKLEGLKPGEWASDPAPRGEGRMLARRLAWLLMDNSAQIVPMRRKTTE